ncbi:hypothetical protein Pyn_10475 [Prunus yedoensis var. nudiflora]|uniref:DUF7477 domain-containing protein n=1 Tax=Prunus yedoensis var. nudiflora TaxID=2094558 RepID=A0A314UYS9_PRUYE|nr:hypothetical protein Pyn_10475 [Prunus yedoensis var. nudiflora]
MAVLETECSFAKSRSSSSASSSSSDYLYGHIRFPTSYDVVFGNSVVSAANLWALIMDVGTGFFSQVYELSTVFLHKDWIMEQWEKNFYISSKAGAANGSSLVVMSKVSPKRREHSFRTTAHSQLSSTCVFLPPTTVFMFFIFHASHISSCLDGLCTMLNSSAVHYSLWNILADKISY